MSKIGLVLEGGGMKCAYTAGILDAMMDNGVTFDYCIGVSAGSDPSNKARREKFTEKDGISPCKFLKLRYNIGGISIPTACSGFVGNRRTAPGKFVFPRRSPPRIPSGVPPPK